MKKAQKTSSNTTSTISVPVNDYSSDNAIVRWLADDR